MAATQNGRQILVADALKRYLILYLSYQLRLLNVEGPSEVNRPLPHKQVLKLLLIL